MKRNLQIQSCISIVQINACQILYSRQPVQQRAAMNVQAIRTFHITLVVSQKDPQRLVQLRIVFAVIG